MLNLFDSCKVYGGKWMVKSERPFSELEISLVERAQVVTSMYGNSCCFFMKNGTTMYVPMATDAKSDVGDFIDMNTATVVTLCKVGEKDITRIKG